MASVNVHLSINFYIFIFSSKIARPNGNKLKRKHLRKVCYKVCSFCPDRLLSIVILSNYTCISTLVFIQNQRKIYIMVLHCAIALRHYNLPLNLSTGFDIDGWPSLFFMGTLKCDLDKVISFHLFVISVVIHKSRITFQFAFRQASKHFLQVILYLFNCSIITQHGQCVLPVLL